MLSESGSEIIHRLLPEIITAVTAAVVLLVGVSRSGSARRTAPGIALVGLLLALVTALAAMTDTSAMGDTSVVASPLAATTKVITLLVSVAIILVAWDLGSLPDRTDLLSMILFSISGVLLVGSSSDLVVLFLALEMVSMPTYVLVAVGRNRIQAQEAGVKYFFLGAMAAAITVYGMSFLYGATGQTRLSGLAQAFAPQAAAAPSGLLAAGLILALIGVSFKIAAAPLHFYAPDVYEGAAAPVTGLLGFLPKIAGFVALVKLLSVAGWINGTELPDQYVLLLAVLAVITMTLGNVVALMQRNVKRMLAYSSIAHSGYMLLGLVVGPAVLTAGGQPAHRDGIVALMFYMAIYGVTNLGAFAVLAVLRLRDDTAEDLDDLAGLSQRHPWAALTMAVCVLSLMGIPPLAGFWGKAYLFTAVWSLGGPFATWLVIIAVINAAIGAGYYLRIVTAMYLRDPMWRPTVGRSPMVRFGAALCALFVIVVGLLPGVILSIAGRSSDHFRHEPVQTIEARHPIGLESSPRTGADPHAEVAR